MMGGTEYEIILSSPTGKPLADLSGIQGFGRAGWFDAPKAANRIARFQLGIPPDFDDRIFKVDQIVAFYRKPRRGVKRLWQAYFLRRWRMAFSGEQESILLTGPDPKDLLRRRHVVAFADSQYASKSDKADDMMREIVRESQSDVIPPVPTAGTRAFPNFTVSPDVGLGPTLDRKFAWGKLLHGSGSGVLPAIAESAREAGTEVFFDVVPTVTNDSISFQLVTNVNQPARDVTGSVIFSRARGNLRDPFLDVNYGAEENYYYVAGPGKADKRQVTQESDAARFNSSPFNRCEGVLQDTNLDTATLRQDAGRERLELGRPRVIAGGIPLDTKGSRFGVDWDYGYRVTMEYRSYLFPVILRAVTLQHRGKRESVITRLDFDGVWPL
jgi:hypothetical protein